MATWRTDPARLRRPIAQGRLRKPPPTGFGWIDRRLVTSGHLAQLTRSESLIYFFLCAVADAQGLSFWGDLRICKELHLDPGELDRARSDLERRGLVLYRPPLYQLLPLPAELGLPKDLNPRHALIPRPSEPETPRPLSDFLRLPHRT